MNTRKISATPLLLWIVCVELSTALKPAAVNITSAPGSPPAEADTNVPDKATGLRQPDNKGLAYAPIGTNKLDGRNAYINNNYVADGEMLSYNDSAPPLYQILQAHMEHILSSSVPAEYSLGNKTVTTEPATDAAASKATNVYGLPVQQSNVNSPIFAYDATNLEEDEDDMIGLYRKEAVEKYYEGTSATKPSSVELPKPMIVGATKVHGVGLRPQLLNSTIKTTSTIKAPTLPTGGYGAQVVLPASQPAAAPSQQYLPSHFLTGGYNAHMPSEKPKIKDDYSATPNKYTSVHQNSTVHMRKRRITFKTVASTSQIVSTPLADLMFKYSIGVARPSMSVGGDSLYEQDVQPIRNAVSTGHNGNIDLSKRVYAGQIPHSSYRKNL